MSNPCMLSLGRTKMRKINPPSVRKDHVSSANVLQNQQDKYISGFRNTGYTLLTPVSYASLSQDADFHGAPICGPEQYEHWFPVKVLQICIHVLHISTVWQKRCGWYWGTDFFQNHLCLCLCPCNLQDLPSILLCLLMFPQLAFLMGSSLGARQYCTALNPRYTAWFLFFFSPDLLLYILNGKYLLPFILVVLSFRQYGIFHFFSFVCVSPGKLFILLCVKRDQK